MLQSELCKEYGAEFLPPDGESIIGIATSIDTGTWPINGLRHPIVGNNNGWYIWAGQQSILTNVFQPVHTHHLKDIVPSIVRYLALPPGWRFLFDPEYEDVWFDQTLIDNFKEQ